MKNHDIAIVKLHTTDSTNNYLKSLNKKKQLDKNTLVWALEQTHGRGQMGTSWNSEADKNLTFSVFRKVERITIDQQFYVTMAASLAVKDVLEKLLIKKINVKWPNDILSDKQKICGILIESVIKKGDLQAVIIGVGLNVNQTEFDSELRATSIKNLTGIHFDLEEILHFLISQFFNYTMLLLEGKLEQIKRDYEARLFRKDKPTTFIRTNGERFVGIIKGVTDLGKLIVWEEGDVSNHYDLKELKMLF